MTPATAGLGRLVLIGTAAAGVLSLAEAGGCWMALLLGVVLARLLRPAWAGSGTHGTAAFATRAEVRAAGMTAGGLHLGQLVVPRPPTAGQALAALFTGRCSLTVMEDLATVFGGRPHPVRLRTRSFAHASVFAASRSGKGASVLVPTLLTYPGPVLVLDPKGELYSVAAAQRQSSGRRAFCVDPYRIVGGTDCYNPLDWIEADNPFVPDLAKDFAVALVARTGQEKERFFHDASEQVIQAVIAATLWGAEEQDRHLVTVADLIASPELLANTLKAMRQSDEYGGVLRTLGHQASQLEGREKASVLASIAQFLGFLNSQPVRDTVRRSTFDPVWLKTHPVDLFLVLPPEKLRSASGFTRYLLTGLLRRLAQGPPDEANPILVILDEAAALGQLPILEDAVSLFAGWGMKLVFVWQSLGQLQDSFPGDKARTFLANMSLQLFGKTNDLETAKVVSERIGDTTVLTTSTQRGGSSSRSSGTEPRQDSTQHGTSWSLTRGETARRLLKPEEVLTLPPELMIAFTDRTPPVLVRQVRYYEPAFRRA